MDVSCESSDSDYTDPEYNFSPKGDGPDDSCILRAGILDGRVVFDRRSYLTAPGIHLHAQRHLLEQPVLLPTDDAQRVVVAGVGRTLIGMPVKQAGVAYGR